MPELTVRPTSSPPIEQIRTINHHLRVAIDRVSDGVLILEADPLEMPGPRIVFANIAARKILGFGLEDLLGQPIGVLYDNEKLRGFLARLPAVSETGKTYQIEVRTNCEGGVVKALRWTVTAMRDHRDTTQNYMITILPEKLSRLAAEAEAARAGRPVAQPTVVGAGEMTSAQIHSSKMESLALVASGIAHDFNNILTTIMANLSLARLETSIQSEARLHIEEATEASEGAKGLIKQLLSFARGTELVKQETDLARLIHEAVRLSTYGANVKCESHLVPHLWGANVDGTQITQVLNNLLINARQAMPSGGVIQVNAENVEIGSEAGAALDLDAGKYVAVSVRDRGVGIAPENLRKIFDPFFTTKKEGTGLGLATCFSLIRKHSGTITVRSKVNIGTEFRIYLPATGRSGHREARAGSKRMISGQGTVLVVDDQECVLAVSAAILSKLGYEPVTATTGQEAIDYYTERMRSGEPVSVILMDMTLPGGMSGSDAFDEIRKVDPDARAIATSGYFDEESRVQHETRGFAGILPKPYSAEALSQALHEVLECVEV
ncbi:MAG: ATP-binding protein [Verrucomicrobiota bacterium]